ncbi:MAG: iron ABC transporter permease [Hyphomicrobiales bacterium]|nr:iron ABC transporter permease [Hyphomicrobiales bacterium]
MTAVPSPIPTASARFGPAALTRLLPVMLTGALLAWLVLVPLAVLVASAFKPSGLLRDGGFTLDHLIDTYGSGQFWRLVATTLQFAIGASLVALVLGATLAWLVERTDLPLPGLVRALVILPMATPPFLLAISWIILLSPRTGMVNSLLMGTFGLAAPPFNIYSLTGMIFVEGLALVPSAFLILAPAARNIDPTLEESALVAGAGTLRLLLRVVLPLLLPALAGTAIFLLIVSLVVFDVPGTIGMPSRIFVLSSQIYSLVADSPRGIPEYGKVSAMALMFAIFLLVLTLAYHRLMRHANRFATVTGKGYRPRRFPLGRLRWLAITGVALYFLCAVLAPLAVLVWTSLMPFQAAPSLAAARMATLANHREFFANPFIEAATLNSIVIAIVASTAVAALSLVTAWISIRSRVPGRRLIDALAFLPLAMPGVLIATALIYVYLAVKLVPIYGTIWIIAVAYLTIYLSFGSRTMNAVVLQLHPELDEAARMSGAGLLATARRIILPLAVPGLAAVWIWVLAHCLRELTAALMLQGADNATLPTLLYSYWSGGETTKAAAVGVWLVIGLIAVVGTWQLLQWMIARRSPRAGTLEPV